MPTEDLVKQAYVNNPQIEQAVLSMKNNEITIKAFKNGLLPTVDAYAFYGANALGGHQNPAAVNFETGQPLILRELFRRWITARRSRNLFNSSAPDKGVGVNINVPLRNRTAQADQARSQMEYRQTQMRMQQLYDADPHPGNQPAVRADERPGPGEAAQAARDYAAQSLDAEQKKYKLGASTTANCAAAGEEPGGCGEYADFGDGGVCEGPGAAAAACWRTRWMGTGSAFRVRP